MHDNFGELFCTAYVIKLHMYTNVRASLRIQQGDMFVRAWFPSLCNITYVVRHTYFEYAN
jgi:hypothetical protein